MTVTEEIQLLYLNALIKTGRAGCQFERVRIHLLGSFITGEQLDLMTYMELTIHQLIFLYTYHIILGVS